MIARSLYVVLILASASCSTQPAAEPNPLMKPPLSLELTVREAGGWTHQNEIRADLDGDGGQERIALLSDVTTGDRGRPLWEDGHRWALLIDDGSGSVLAYSAFVPNGFVEAAVLTESPDGTREVLIQERTPGQLRSLVIAYDEAGTVRPVSAAHYAIEQWLPGSARLMD